MKFGGWKHERKEEFFQRTRARLLVFYLHTHTKEEGSKERLQIKAPYNSVERFLKIAARTQQIWQLTSTSQPSGAKNPKGLDHRSHNGVQ